MYNTPQSGWPYGTASDTSAELDEKPPTETAALIGRGSNSDVSSLMAGNAGTRPRVFVAELAASVVIVGPTGRR